jgi:hypothetical protein
MSTSVLRLCLWGPVDDSALGRLNRAAEAALRSQQAVAVVTEFPDLTLITAAVMAPTAPGDRLVFFPWSTDVDAWSGTAWAASRWHQKVLGGAPRVAMGAFVHVPRPAPPEDGGIVLLIIPAAAPPPTVVLDHLGEGVYPVREAPGVDDLPSLPADPAQRATIWYDAAAVVLMPGCACSVSLAIEARSAGVPVLVPKGDPADELILVNGIGAYGVRLGEVPEPDLAALSMRLSRMAGNNFAVREVDLSAWAWDHWATVVVAEARALVPAASPSRIRGGGLLVAGKPVQGAIVGMTVDSEDGHRRRYAIFSLTPVTGNVAMEGLLARVLIDAGFEPQVIRCNGLRQRCSMDMVNPDFASRTALCLNCTVSAESYQAAWCGQKLATVLLDELVSPDALVAAEARLAAVPDLGLLSFTYDGMPLGRWVESALRLDYFGEDWRSLDNLPTVTRAWLRSLLPIAIAAEAYFASERPAGATLLSGVMPWEKIVHTLAQRHGIRCIYYEGGQRPGSMALRDSTPACRYDFSPEWREWADVPLTVAESAQLDRFLRNRQGFGQGMIYVFSPAASGELDRVRTHVGLKVGRPVLVAFTSVVVDAISYEAHLAFESQAVWLEACVAYAVRHPEVDLVIRVHPAEQTSVTFRGPLRLEANDSVADVLRRRWSTLPDNVRLVQAADETSSYDLLSLATVVLNYVSTVGLEAAAAGKAVVTSGVSHYSAIGVVWQVNRADAFAATVDRAMAVQGPPPDGAEIARRYLYFWFYRCTPVMPGLPHATADVVALPKARLAYWDVPGPPEGVPRYAAYLAGQGPFVLPPASHRPRDAGIPLPLNPLPTHLALVFPAGWDVDELVEQAIRPLLERRSAWRVIVVIPAGDLPSGIRDLASALARRDGPEAAVVFVPETSSDLPVWWALASTAVMPQLEAEAEAVLVMATAHGVPLWRGTVAEEVPALAGSRKETP